MKRTIMLALVAILLVAMVPSGLAQQDSMVQARNIQVMKNGSANAVPTAVSAARPVLKSVAARKIQAMNTEQVREELRSKFQAAIEKCDDTNASERCRAALQTRIATMNKVSAANIERIQVFEQRKFDKIAKLDESLDSNFSKYAKGTAFKAREIVKEKIQDAKQKYLSAKQRFVNAKKAMNQSRDRFENAKMKLSECQGNETDECAAVRENITVEAKDHLLNIADVILDHLDTLQSRVESNEDLTEEESADLLARISDERTKIESLKATIESSESKDEVIAAAKELRQEWAKLDKKLDIMALRLVHARVGNIIVKAEQLDIKLERIMQRMEEAGYDTSGVQDLVDTFSADIASAKDDYGQAMEKFRESKNADDQDDSLVKEAHELMQSAHDSLKDAQETLRQIVATIKGAGAEDVLSDGADDVIAEVDADAATDAEVSE